MNDRQTRCQFNHNNWTDLAGKAQSPCAIVLVV